MAVHVVSFRCVLKNSQGQVLSSSVNQNVLADGTDNQLISNAIAEALTNLKTGESCKVALRAEEAYGCYNPKLVVVRPIDEIVMSEPVRLGESISYVSEGKQQMYRVTEVSHDSITLDANHIYAGQDLVFEIEAIASRVATPSELEVSDVSPRAAFLH